METTEIEKKEVEKGSLDDFFDTVKMPEEREASDPNVNVCVSCEG